MRFPRATAFIAAISMAFAPAAAQAGQAAAPQPAVEQVDAGAANSLGDQPLGAMHYLGFAAILVGIAYLIYTQFLNDDDEDVPLSA